MSTKVPDILSNTIRDMESSLGDIQGWTKALIVLGSAEYSIDPHAIAMIAHALEKQVEALNDLWRSAHALTHDHLKPGR